MRLPSNRASLCGDGAPESKLDVPCVRSAEARVVVVEDDRRRLAEASDEIAADRGGMHSDESDVIFLGFMPHVQSSPSSSIKTGRSHKGEQQAAVPPPQSPRLSI